MTKAWWALWNRGVKSYINFRGGEEPAGSVVGVLAARLLSQDFRSEFGNNFKMRIMIWPGSDIDEPWSWQDDPAFQFVLGLEDSWQCQCFVVCALLHSIWTLLPIVTHQRPFQTFLDAIPFPSTGQSVNDVMMMVKVKSYPTMWRSSRPQYSSSSQKSCT